MIKYLISTLLILFVVVSCNSDKTNTSDGFGDGDDFSVPDSILNQEEAPLVVSEEAMGDIIQNVSSPVEMASLLKDEGVKFNYKLLSPTSDADNYNTNFKQALNLGILGADLGYLNMYSKTTSVIDYITAIKSLSDNLMIGQFFDFTTLKRLATNSENIDSLMYISVSSFDKMDEYLRETNRSNISTLIITGVWIEGLYLATQVSTEKKIDKINERIGEQKMALNDILIIVDNYKSDKNFYKLSESLNKLKKSFEGVKITFEAGESEMKEVDGVLTIVQNDKSIVNISDEDLAKIVEATKEVRDNIIKL